MTSTVFISYSYTQLAGVIFASGKYQMTVNIIGKPGTINGHRLYTFEGRVPSKNKHRMKSPDNGNNKTEAQRRDERPG